MLSQSNVQFDKLVKNLQVELTRTAQTLNCQTNISLFSVALINWASSLSIMFVAEFLSSFITALQFFCVP